MDYINPTSIAGMYNVPKDNSLPGAGHGLLQGYLEGQAANRANEFLEMSKMGQAQDYAKNQFLNQKAWQMAPLEMQARQLGNQHLQSQIAESGINQDKAKALIQKLQQEGKLDKFIAASQFHGPFQNAKSDLEKRAAVEQYNYFMRQMDPQHQEYSWDGDPSSWNKLVSDVGLAGQIAKINRDYAQKSGLLGEEYGYKGGMQDKQLRSAEKIAGMEAGTRRYVADKAHTDSGDKLTEAQRKAQLFEMWKTLPDGDPNKAMIERMLTQGYATAQFNKDPEVVGRAAEAKAEAETVGQFTGINRAKNALKEVKEGILKPSGQYDSVLQQRGLDPSKYEVRIENGRIMAYPK